jgi:hypothetical protein
MLKTTANLNSHFIDRLSRILHTYKAIQKAGNTCIELLGFYTIHYNGFIPAFQREVP